MVTEASGSKEDKVNGDSPGTSGSNGAGKRKFGSNRPLRERQCSSKVNGSSTQKQLSIASMFPPAKRKETSNGEYSPEQSNLHSKNSIPLKELKLENNVNENGSSSLNNHKVKNGTALPANGDLHIKMETSINTEDPLVEESLQKKPKQEFESRRKENVKKNTTPAVNLDRCYTCHQLLSNPDLKIYEGHPDGAVEEYVALTDSRLSLFSGQEESIHEQDERPQNKITHFAVYDKEGHLCPFDNGIIERNGLIYFSGYIKAVYEENSDPEGGVPAKDMGPINEWWISGFDGGELALIGFSTAYGDYYLMEPNESYFPFMDATRQKIFLSKAVIEFLLETVDPSYEDLLNKLQTVVPPSGISCFSEDILLQHAQFVCDQVMSFDSASEDPENNLLIATPCMRSLIKLAGVTFGKRQAMRRVVRKDVSKPPKCQWSKATTTNLVQEVFEAFFEKQIDKENEKENMGPKRRRCGVCEACQSPDCGMCNACKDMVKFGGSGRSKQACVQRRCPNMAIEAAEDSDPDDDTLGQEEKGCPLKIGLSQNRKKISVSVEKRNVSWTSEVIKKTGPFKYYGAFSINDEEFKINDYVVVNPGLPATPVLVAKISYMWEDEKGSKWFHATWLCRGTDTVLGETADPLELYVVDECENTLISAVRCHAKLHYTGIPENWRELGGENVNNENKFEDDGKTFFYQKRYDVQKARFEDLVEDPPCMDPTPMYCAACVRRKLHDGYEKPTVCNKLDKDSPNNEIHYSLVKWRGEEYCIGSSVYLMPTTFKFRKTAVLKDHKPKDREVDEELYPEYYRKTSDSIKGSNDETPEPFCIGHISSIFIHSSDIISRDVKLRVNKFYRPENTMKDREAVQQADLNKLYWSDEECVISFENVVGKCYVVYSENVDVPVSQWTDDGPDRFYFSEAYDSSTRTFDEPCSKAMLIGSQGKGKGKGKGKAKSSDEKKKVEIKQWPQISKKLKSLDVFAGCGGLSEGLHQSGVAESLWAVEKEEVAAHAFRLNNPDCTVFTEDCNLLLKLVMNGESTNDKKQRLPQKGEVDLLCGGPPCQGFSGMNRFNSRQYSLFKNSLIVSYLSYCDYYRPKYFILENVRNFVSFKRSMVLKLTLRCLLKMGYQCTFGILQAGNYGVPQTRRRAIILAAAPGEILPNFPEPTHAFSPRACQLSVVVDDKKFTSNCRWVDSAPRRTVTVRDAMSDLPEIRNGHKKEEMSYGGEPLTHFQRMVRGMQYQPILRDHICKEMAPIIEARIANIPTACGSDWRDLPNIVVRLSDGSYTKKLLYTHHDKKNGRSSTGALRGVCACAVGKPCDPVDKQTNTLIPWCLPHTGNRHNHWAGLYGRLEWDGFFSTTVTNPEPMGKQGRVLHPEQTRVVSVRECARSQGFPDTYRFFGSVLDKHRQVGNAVPPPLGAALGFEIRKSVSLSEQKQQAMKTE